jgi:hypothetical protein
MANRSGCSGVMIPDVGMNPPPAIALNISEIESKALVWLKKKQQDEK